MLSMPSSLSFCCTVRQKDSQLAPSGTGTATFLQAAQMHVDGLMAAAAPPIHGCGSYRLCCSTALVHACDCLLDDTHLLGLASLTDTNTSRDASCKVK